jgi:hypothetical protein
MAFGGLSFAKGVGRKFVVLQIPNSGPEAPRAKFICMGKTMDDNEIKQETAVNKLLNPQGLLFHYTSQEGFLGILKDRKIWASHIRYLNDTKEYYAGRSLIKSVLLLMKELDQADEETAKIVEETLEIFDGFDIYVTSFSKAEDGDSLNLWRAYAHTPPGYSIGFRAETLSKFIRSTRTEKHVPRPEMTGLFGVLYVPELGKDYQIRQDLIWLAQLLRAIILRLKETDINAFFKNESYRGLPVAEITSVLKQSLDVYKKSAIILSILLPLLKHEGFIAEQEQRIVKIRVADDDFEHCSDLEFHRGNSSIIPHLQVDLPPGDLGIEKIVVGPCPDPVWAVRAVEMLLTKKKIKIRRPGDAEGVEVVPSKIPYRNW